MLSGLNIWKGAAVDAPWRIQREQCPLSVCPVMPISVPEDHRADLGFIKVNSAAPPLVVRSRQAGRELQL